MVTKTSSIVIVGAGVFGLTTALELHNRGYTNITILDRFLAPVPDGSSTDISRIVRADYADPLYSKMASESQALWRTTYKDFYHPCGYVNLSQTAHHPYIAKAKATLTKLNLPFQELRTSDDVKTAYPDLKNTGGNFSAGMGYCNNGGGWAHAAHSMAELARQCSLAGISFITGSRGTVLSLQKEGKKVKGLNLAQGPSLSADIVILAAGAWSCRLIDLSQHALSTCQPIGFIQLTPEESAEIAKVPIIVNATTGWFCFPPDLATNTFKVARHGFGYTNSVSVSNDLNPSGKQISAPPRDENSAAESWLPAEADQALRDGLRKFFPKLAEKPWLRTRLCWYTDTPTGDFMIDYHPDFEGLFVATGGSGHAFKFLPVLGKYVVDCFENVADELLREKWRARPSSEDVLKVLGGDGSRGGPPRKELDRNERAKI